MRRIGRNRLACVLAAAAVLPALPLDAWAQTDTEPQAQGTASDEPVALPKGGGLDLSVTARRRTRCGVTGPDGAIVVCGADHGEDLKVPGSADDPDTREGQNTGVPQAPNVSGLFSCKGKKCHGFGGVPGQVYMLDVKAIKEAPKGSDADKVANGEMSDR